MGACAIENDCGYPGSRMTAFQICVHSGPSVVKNLFFVQQKRPDLHPALKVRTKLFKLWLTVGRRRRLTPYLAHRTLRFALSTMSLYTISQKAIVTSTGDKWGQGVEFS